MPLTLPSHPGLVAPLTLIDRGRLDGVALLVGATAPDLPYAWSRSGWPGAFDGHTIPAIVLFAAPAAVALAVVFRRWVARPLAVHLPDAGPCRLRDVAFAAGDRYRWWWTYLCGLLGAAAHLLFDGFTHPEPWAVDLVGRALDRRVDPPLLGPHRLHGVLYMALSALGAVLAVACVAYAGRRRARAGVPRPVLPAATGASWWALLLPLELGVLVGLLAANAAWGAETVAGALMLALWATGAGLIVGCAAAGRALGLRPGDPGMPAVSPPRPARRAQPL
ncbi:MAG TPA: DUF4184 family protein [Acidimicrobiales bacterium]